MDHPRGHPLFSIVMLTHDRQRFIRDTLASLLAQACVDWELVVVDDSRESWVAARMAVWAEENFLAPDRVRVAVLPPGAPLTHKRNVSICLSRGDIIAQADDDDISYPNRLDVLADAFVADSALMLCSADAVVINEDGKIIYDEEGKARLYRFPIRYHWQGQDRELGFHTTAVAYRREAAFAAGLYHPDWQEKGGGRLGKNGMRIGEDFDFYRRILERFGPDSARMLDKVLVQYRLHTGMLTALG